jgi:hypothetical protein
MSKQERDVFFNGRKNADGGTINRGAVAIGGVKEAEVHLPRPVVEISSDYRR